MYIGNKYLDIGTRFDSIVQNLEVVYADMVVITKTLRKRITPTDYGKKQLDCMNVLLGLSLGNTIRDYINSVPVGDYTYLVLNDLYKILRLGYTDKIIFSKYESIVGLNDNEDVNVKQRELKVDKKHIGNVDNSNKSLTVEVCELLKMYTVQELMQLTTLILKLIKPVTQSKATVIITA